jgi:hypothetical protein
LGVLERLHSQQHAGIISKAFETGEISMRAFLKRHLPFPAAVDESSNNKSEGEGRLWSQKVQLAMSLTTSFDPDQILHDIVQEQEELVAARDIKIANMKRIQSERERRRLQESEVFLEYHHSMPVLFDHAEVAKLNEGRAQHNRLELMSSGLLKHHCCYPSCPGFLQSFATATDKLKGTRTGLYKHLQYDQSCLHNYVPMFHLVAKTLVPKLKSLEEFRDAMDQHFAKSSWYQRLIIRSAKLEGLWLQLTKEKKNS